MATLPHRMNSILIVFIFRPNQDPSQYSNYRPMSLINLGIKMISKDLSFRLGSIISALTNTDQTRFPINPHDFWWHYWIPRRCLIGVEWSVPFSSFSHFRFGPYFLQWMEIPSLQKTGLMDWCPFFFLQTTQRCLSLHHPRTTCSVCIQIGGFVSRLLIKPQNSDTCLPMF